MELPAPLIVGGGPAGSAAAIQLARGGCRPTLIERQPGPVDKVCGDFLSAEAITIITALGVDLAALDPAPIRALRLVHGGGAAETRLPFPAMAVSRRVLDEALLTRAAAEGAVVHRGHAVRRVEVDELRVDAGALGTFRPPAIFLATGKHDLRGLARPGRTGGPIGLKNYFVLAPAQHAALAGHVELVMFPGGYAGTPAGRSRTGNVVPDRLGKAVGACRPTLGLVAGRADRQVSASGWQTRGRHTVA